MTTYSEAMKRDLLKHALKEAEQEALMQWLSANPAMGYEDGYECGVGGFLPEKAETDDIMHMVACLLRLHVERTVRVAIDVACESADELPPTVRN